MSAKRKWISLENKILDETVKASVKDKFALKGGKFPKMEEALYQWFIEAHNSEFYDSEI